MAAAKRERRGVGEPELWKVELSGLSWLMAGGEVGEIQMTPTSLALGWANKGDLDETGMQGEEET